MDKRIKKGSAVLTAWTLIAVMGISPAGAAFPSYASVMERSDHRKLKLADGGDVYLFGTTSVDGRHVIVRTVKQ